MYQVQLNQFSGPLEKLLNLIQERQIEITTINLAKVTNDFIEYVQKLDKNSSPVLSDFVVIASHLLLIKSKVLLPSLELTEEEQTDILSLEHRLTLYKQFKQAANHLDELWQKNNISYSRPLLASLTQQSFFYPPKNLKIQDLKLSISELSSSLNELVPETKKIKKTFISLSEKIKQLANRLNQVASFSFKGVMRTNSKGEIIISFLAVLHMLSNRLADAEQASQFGDIIILQSNNQTESA